MQYSRKLQKIAASNDGKNISNAELMCRTNIIAKIKTGQYMAFDKVESICKALECTPNDMMEFIKNNNEGADSNE